jgi:hypothetical protein
MNGDEIQLRVPSGARGVVVKGVLLRAYSTADLDQDILEVDLPNGLTIHVGWRPEYDPHGHFEIVLCRDYWRNQERPPISAEDVYEVKRIVEGLIEEFTDPRPTRALSAAASTFQKVTYPSGGLNLFVRPAA